jgi:hypothetical protein
MVASLVQPILPIFSSPVFQEMVLKPFASHVVLQAFATGSTVNGSCTHPQATN